MKYKLNFIFETNKFKRHILCKKNLELIFQIFTHLKKYKAKKRYLTISIIILFKKKTCSLKLNLQLLKTVFR